MYATSASRSAAGRLPYLFGIGGFLVDFAFAAMSFGWVIHCLMSSADSFPPTPSSGFALLPFPATEWHIAKRGDERLQDSKSFKLLRELIGRLSCETVWCLDNSLPTD